MVNRPAGGDRSKKWERAPYDWYREGPPAVQQVIHGLARAGVHLVNDAGVPDLIWDPCCGAGNVLDVMKAYGHATVGSDIIDRHPRHRFFRANVLTGVRRAPTMDGRATTIISNTPYSYEPEIAERVISQCLHAFSDRVRRFIFILPIAFMASEHRWRDGRLLQWKPSHVAFYRQRHTMPPGHLIDTMDKPYKGGMADYVALVYTRPHRWRSEAIWLPVGQFPDPPARVQHKEKAVGKE